MSEILIQESSTDLISREKEILKLFKREWLFMAGASNIHQLPSFLNAPEIAFVGKSNVGKSSLINYLTGRKTLARTSKTPGRTKQINFFTVDNQLTFVDLPGYGYAKVSKREQNIWQQLILSYFKNSQNLKTVCLLVDGRRGIKTHDQQVMDLLKKFDIPFFLTFTKTDKINNAELSILTEQSQKILALYNDNFVDFLFTSARRNDDTEKLRISLAKYIANQ